MNTVEMVKALCKEKHIAISKLEKDLGFANGYISGLKKGTIPHDRLILIAEYLEVPPSDLLGAVAVKRPHNIIRVYHDSDAEKRPKGIEAFTGTGKLYYLNEKTAELAQKYFEDPKYRVLFDALEGSSFENIELAAEILNRMKKTNPDG